MMAGRSVSPGSKGMASACPMSGGRRQAEASQLNAAAGEGGLRRQGERQRVAGQAAVEGIEDG